MSKLILQVCTAMLWLVPSIEHQGVLFRALWGGRRNAGTSTQDREEGAGPVEIRSVRQFLDYWDGLRGRTRRVAECIPPDRLEWTYRAGSFTLGDLVRHLATIERYMYAETVAGRPSSYPGCGRELADGYDVVMAYFERPTPPLYGLTSEEVRARSA
jgi:hypothetical protein